MGYNTTKKKCHGKHDGLYSIKLHEKLIPLVLHVRCQSLP